MASAQSADCVNWANGIANCQSRLATASTNLDSFCRECGNVYVSYFEECANGAGATQVKQCKLIYLVK